MGQSFFQGTQQAFNAVGQRLESAERQLMTLSHVLKEIVGKELMRGQALHKVLMDKALLTDEELKTALETIIAEAKSDLEAQATKVAEVKEKAVEILVPDHIKAPKADGE